MKKHTDAQIKLLLDEKGIDWHTFDQGKKYGRLIAKEYRHYSKTLENGQYIEFDRNEFTPNDCDNWTENSRQIVSLIK